VTTEARSPEVPTSITRMPMPSSLGVLSVARFVPLLRSFAPFVAGVARMRRDRFTFFDVSGGALWVVSLTVAGYWFGNMPWVQQHFDKIILALLAMTVLIALSGRWAAKRARHSPQRS
jgi:membrane-associated protein